MTPKAGTRDNVHGQRRSMSDRTRQIDVKMTCGVLKHFGWPKIFKVPNVPGIRTFRERVAMPLLACEETFSPPPLILSRHKQQQQR